MANRETSVDGGWKLVSFGLCVFSGSFGVRSIVLCKCIDIYFNLKITYSISLSIRGSCFMTSFDWKDTYFQIFIHQALWKYLRFVLGEVVYQFKSLFFLTVDCLASFYLCLH